MRKSSAGDPNASGAPAARDDLRDKSAVYSRLGLCLRVRIWQRHQRTGQCPASGTSPYIAFSLYRLPMLRSYMIIRWSESTFLAAEL